MKMDITVKEMDYTRLIRFCVRLQIGGERRYTAIKVLTRDELRVTNLTTKGMITQVVQELVETLLSDEDVKNDMAFDLSGRLGLG